MLLASEAAKGGDPLRVRAELDTGAYDTGVKISDAQMDALPLTRHDWHGDWNYTLHPQDYDQAAGVPDPFDRPSPGLAWLCHPPLTGLPPEHWDALITTLMALHDQQRETSLDKRRGHRPRRIAPGTGPPSRPHSRRPAPGHGPPPAPRLAPGHHRRPIRRAARDDQQAHRHYPPAPGPGRTHHPARPAPTRQPR
jgi:Rhodopirellula transposase DDE domain